MSIRERGGIRYWKSVWLCSSLVVGDEDCIGPNGEFMTRLSSTFTTSLHIRMFDCWADPFAHLLLLKRSMVKQAFSTLSLPSLFLMDMLEQSNFSVNNLTLTFIDELPASFHRAKYFFVTVMKHALNGRTFLRLKSDLWSVWPVKIRQMISLEKNRF